MYRVHQILLMQLVANVTKEAYHAVFYASAKNAQTFLVQNLQNQQVKKELDIPMPCKQKSHLVKILQLIEEKKYLEDFFSSFETIVLGEICMYYESEDLEVCNIHELYNDIVYYSACEFCTQPLQDNMVFRTKTHAQISSKIKYSATHSFV